MAQFLETFKDRALEFPAIIDSNGRARIHLMCNYLGIASHSQGQGNKRRIIVYPRNLFKNKQEQEAKKIQKEREKLREKLQVVPYAPKILDNPVTMHDRMIRDIWFELQGKPLPPGEEKWEGDPAVRIAELKVKLKAFEDKVQREKEEYEKKTGKKISTPKQVPPAQTQKPAEELKESENKESLQHLKFEEIPNDGNATVLKYKGKQQANPSPSKGTGTEEESKGGATQAWGSGKQIENDDDANSDLEEEALNTDDLDENFFKMTDLQKKEYLESRSRIKQQKRQEFEKQENFHKQLKENTLKTFKDKPDAITSVRCVHVEGSMFVVEWDAP